MEWLEALVEWLSDAFDASDVEEVNLSDAGNEISNAAQTVISSIDLDSSGGFNLNNLTQAVFNFIDKNGSGQLDSEDFKQLMIGYLDKNGDGQISSIDTAIRNAAIQVGEEFGPLAKGAFSAAVKKIL